MTTGANALLAWFRQPLAKIQTTKNKATNTSQRQYRIHARRTCYQCRQEGHYARDCPRAATLKTAETKLEKMRLLLKSMTSTERAQFKREISHQMRTMQAHLRTMTTLELEEFKRQVVPNTAPALVTLLSRETNSHTDPTLTEAPPSRETGPHPRKSMKKLAQALKKRTEREAERRTHTSEPHHSFKVLAETPKPLTRTSHPDSSMKRLANALKRCSEPKERCDECKEEHPTRFCLKCFERLRRPQTTPFFASD